jgi:L-asparaginase
MSKKLPALAIHAGAGNFPLSKGARQIAHESLSRIAAEAYIRLRRGTALKAVAWAVSQLEDDPQFNAGTGGKLQSDGIARLTASIMDGFAPRFSGVMNIEQVKNPVLVAKKLLRFEDRVLTGQGARRFARQNDFRPYNPITDQSWQEWREGKGKTKFGTVGAVAVDAKGRLAAATSTGGKGMELVGRVSDSATVAGNFASKSAAVSCTGLGEEIVEHALAARIVVRVDDGATLREAFQKTFREFKKLGFRAGAIGVDRSGHVEVAKTTPTILYVACTPSHVRGYP